MHTIAFGAGDRVAIPGETPGSVIVLTFDRPKPQRPPLRRELQGHTAPVSGLAFGKDETELLSGAEDGAVCLWRLPAS